MIRWHRIARGLRVKLAWRFAHGRRERTARMSTRFKQSAAATPSISRPRCFGRGIRVAGASERMFWPNLVIRKPRPFRRQSTRPLLAALRRERNPSVLASLVTALGRLGIRSAIPKLFGLANHRSPEVRRALAAELPWCTWDSGEERPDRRVTAALVDLTGDPVAEVRGWACFSLAGSIADSPEIRNALWGRIGDRHYDTRVDALRGLAIRRDPRVHQPLREAVRVIGTRRFGSWVMDDLIAYAKRVGDRQLLNALKR